MTDTRLLYRCTGDLLALLHKALPLSCLWPREASTGRREKQAERLPVAKPRQCMACHSARGGAHVAAAARAEEASAARVHAGTVRARPRNMVRQNAVGASTPLTEHTMGACSPRRARRHTCSVRQGLVWKSGRPGFARHSRTLGFTSVVFHVPEGLALACCWLRSSTHARAGTSLQTARRHCGHRTRR